MELVESIFSIFGAVVTNGVELLGDLFSSILNFFWTTEGTPTTLGVLLLISVATPLVIWGLGWVMKLIKSIKLK